MQFFGFVIDISKFACAGLFVSSTIISKGFVLFFEAFQMAISFFSEAE